MKTAASSCGNSVDETANVDLLEQCNNANRKHVDMSQLINPTLTKSRFDLLHVD
jgi:hypothetical protein